MSLPTTAELITKLDDHVDAASGEDDFLGECVRDSVAFITGRVPNTAGGAEVVDGVLVPVEETSPLGDDLYRREVIELAADLYYRRKAKNGVVSVDKLGNPIRLANDPYKASTMRLGSLRPLGFA